jgi:hypothetical protein
MEWQPIETAPKDGRLVDVWTVRGRVADVHWGVDTEGNQAVGWLKPYNPDINSQLMREGAPTHWMPLPASPKGTK